MLLIFLYVFLATIQDNGILRVCYNGLLSRCKDWSIEMKTFTYMYIHVFVTVTLLEEDSSSDLIILINFYYI